MEFLLICYLIWMFLITVTSSYLSISFELLFSTKKCRNINDRCYMNCSGGRQNMKVKSVQHCNL